MDKKMESLGYEWARRVVNEYLEVLKGVAPLLTLGAPEILLPAGKDEIRQAIRRLAQSAAAGGLSEAARVETLRNAYLSLASFLAYEEANAAARLQAAFARGDRVFIGSRAAAETMARAQRIEQDAGLLAREFDGFLKTQVEDELLIEIDQVLADVSDRLAAARV
jgi:hypothetical protein